MINKYEYICRENFKGAVKPELQKKCIEILCLGVLRACFYPNFESFVHSDSPDLFDERNKIGIEVCEAIREEDAKVLSEYSKLCYGNKVQETKSLQIFNDNGYSYSDGILTGSARSENIFLEAFKKITSKKLSLINKYLTKEIKQIGLAIYCKSSITMDYSRDIVDIYKELIRNRKGYDFIYFIFSHVIYYYEVVYDKLNIIEIDIEDFNYIQLLSRSIVEGKRKFTDEEWLNLTKR